MPTIPLPVIRPACPDDVRALIALENSSFISDRISARSYSRFLKSPSSLILVAEPSSGSSELAGSAVILFRRNSSTARLYSIAVDPGHAGCGLGKALLKEAEDAARRRQCKTMRLEVREDNNKAIGFYGDCGYLPAGRVANYYEDGCAALRFEKPLTTRREART